MGGQKLQCFQDKTTERESRIEKQEAAGEALLQPRGDAPKTHDEGLTTVVDLFKKCKGHQKISPAWKIQMMDEKQVAQEVGYSSIFSGVGEEPVEVLKPHLDDMWEVGQKTCMCPGVNVVKSFGSCHRAQCLFNVCSSDGPMTPLTAREMMTKPTWRTLFFFETERLKADIERRISDRVQKRDATCQGRSSGSVLDIRQDIRRRQNLDHPDAPATTGPQRVPHCVPASWPASSAMPAEPGL